jgi:hypothetical protein
MGMVEGRPGTGEGVMVRVPAAKTRESEGRANGGDCV